MSETIQKAFLEWWRRVDGDVCGEQRRFAEGCWEEAVDASLEWAAGQAAEQAKGWREEARGQGGVEYKERARRIAQELDALAAKIREGAP